MLACADSFSLSFSLFHLRLRPLTLHTLHLSVVLSIILNRLPRSNHLPLKSKEIKLPSENKPFAAVHLVLHRPLYDLAIAHPIGHKTPIYIRWCCFNSIMAAQAALIADTIVGMKRALRKENDCMSCLPLPCVLLASVFASVEHASLHVSLLSDSGPDDPITQPTNRGNKMRANAKYVREGALGYIHPEELFKQVISSLSLSSFSLSLPLSFSSFFSLLSFLVIGSLFDWARTRW